MKLTFSNENLQRLWADAEKHWPNGTRPSYTQQDDEVIPRGFWIVGDHGVYLMHNGMFPDGEKPVVIYAEECNPDTSPDDWWDVKRATFGGDDGVDVVELETVKSALDKGGWLEFEFDENSMQIVTLWNPPN